MTVKTPYPVVLCLMSKRLNLALPFQICRLQLLSLGLVFGWAVFSFPGNHPMALASPKFWGLQHNLVCTVSSSCKDLSVPPRRDYPATWGVSQPQMNIHSMTLKAENVTDAVKSGCLLGMGSGLLLELLLHTLWFVVVRNTQFLRTFSFTSCRINWGVGVLALRTPFPLFILF